MTTKLDRDQEACLKILGIVTINEISYSLKSCYPKFTDAWFQSQEDEIVVESQKGFIVLTPTETPCLV
ncbi:MAG: hypothetical protein H8D45_23905 [Bacteroidetes bacterium]|nr:hypothetical protein [Bacteroidota bacterium]MBL7105805.1 hypothetical protein [Bacteroidales bacterium]